MSEQDTTIPQTSNGQDSGREPTAKFDRDELVRAIRAYSSKTPTVLPTVKFAAKTDMGQVRENNEDKFDFYEPEDPSLLASRGCFYAVADGIGGAQAGQIASEQALKTIISGYYDNATDDLLVALRDSIVASNDRIHALSKMIPERNGMGATLTAAVFCEESVYIAQVGDSRAYCLREGAIYQITVDHSWVEEQVQSGLMTREEAENSPFRNVITRSIGSSPKVNPDFYQEEIKPGDIWLLCSDGLTAYASPDELKQIIGSNPPSEATRQLIELANARGGRDNITAFVISVREIQPYRSEEIVMQDPPTVTDMPPIVQDTHEVPDTPPKPEHEQKKSVWRSLFSGHG